MEALVIIVILLILGLVVLAIAIAAYFVMTQRKLVSLDELCKNALSQIEVQLNSRFDVVLSMAKTAAKYAAHESETIIKAVEARGGGGGAATPGAINQQNDLLGQLMGRMNVVFERYPELKASENRMVRQWPSSIVASMLHFGEKEYLKVDDEKKRNYPDLDAAFAK